MNTAGSAFDRRRLWAVAAIASVFGLALMWFTPSYPPPPPETAGAPAPRRPLRLPRVVAEVPRTPAPSALKTEFVADTDVAEEPEAPTWDQVVHCELGQCRYQWPINGLAALASLGAWRFDEPVDLKDPNTRVTMSTPVFGFKRAVIFELSDMPVFGPEHASNGEMMLHQAQAMLDAVPAEDLEEMAAPWGLGSRDMAVLWLARIADEQGAAMRIYALEPVLDEVGEPTGYERGEELEWGW